MHLIHCKINYRARLFRANGQKIKEGRLRADHTIFWYDTLKRLGIRQYVKFLIERGQSPFT
jgi:hypothetical protein